MFNEISDFCVIAWLLLLLFCTLFSVPGYTPCEPSQAMAEIYYSSCRFLCCCPAFILLVLLLRDTSAGK